MKILFGGDLSFSHFKEYPGNEAVEKMFAQVKPCFDKADFGMLNLESVFNKGFTPIIKSGPNIAAVPEFVYALNYLGIDVAGLANNHLGDYGHESMVLTMDILKQNGIAYVGAGNNIAEAYEAHVLSKDGVNVSILAICENEFGIATAQKSGAAGYRLGMTAHAIAREKAKGNYVVIFFHGGNENDPYPSPKKQELYRMFVELGADAVVAMHTHCPQGYETYQGKPIIYSMGNFFFPHGTTGNFADPNYTWYYGYMTQLEIADGKITAQRIPYHFTFEQMELLTGEKLEAFERYMQTLCAPIGDEEELRRLFEGWAMITGPVYADLARYTEAMIDDQDAVRHMKNNFSCEAHNELLTAYFDLCYEGRTTKVKPVSDHIKSLQTIVLD